MALVVAVAEAAASTLAGLSNFDNFSLVDVGTDMLLERGITVKLRNVEFTSESPWVVRFVKIGFSSSVSFRYWAVWDEVAVGFLDVGWTLLPPDLT